MKRLGWIILFVLVLNTMGGEMSKRMQFINQPLEKKANRQNIVTRLERVERSNGPAPSATIGNLSELSPDAGDQIAGTYFVVDQQNGAVRGYLTAHPRDDFPGYYLAFFNSAGVFQFGINADDGSAVAGAGAVTLDADGVTIVQGTGAANKIKWVTTGGEDVAHFYANEGTGGTLTYLAPFGTNSNPIADFMVLATGKGSNAKISLRAGGSSYTENLARIELGGGAKFDATYNETYIAAFQSSFPPVPTPKILLHSEDGASYININNSREDVDTFLYGTSTDAVIQVDAGLNAVGIGGAASSDYKEKIYGDLNVTEEYYRDGTLYAPKCAAFYADEVITSVTGWARVLNANQPYNFHYTTTAANAADGDEYTASVFIAAGTYTLSHLGRTAATLGKTDYYIDATLVGSGVDWYSGGTVDNVTKTVASVVISTSGYHKVTIKLNGKNAASSDYVMQLTKLWLTPAAY